MFGITVQMTAFGSARPRDCTSVSTYSGTSSRLRRLVPAQEVPLITSSDTLLRRSSQVTWPTLLPGFSTRTVQTSY